jgi:hypothetical protein
VSSLKKLANYLVIELSGHWVIEFQSGELKAGRNTNHQIIETLF